MTIEGLLIHLMIFCFTYGICIWWKSRPIIIKMESDKWVPVTINQGIPENVGHILVTDGKFVDDLPSEYLKYNKFGRPIMSTYSKKELTHWMPFPEPPKD